MFKCRTFCLLLTINYIRKMFCTIISFRAKITFKGLSSPWNQKQFWKFLMFCGQSTIYAHFSHMLNYDMKHVKCLRKIYVGVKRSIIQSTTCVWFTTYEVIAIHRHWFSWLCINCIKLKNKMIYYKLIFHNTKWIIFTYWIFFQERYF